MSFSTQIPGIKLAKLVVVFNGGYTPLSITQY